MTRASRPKWRRGLARGVAIGGVVLAVLAVRVVLASRSELRAADRLRAAGKVDAAIVHYRRAARWYAPASPYVTDALVHLAKLGRSAEASGDVGQALSAWRAVRAAIMSTRSFYVPHRAALEEANHHIARLMASLEPPPIDAGKSRDEIRREHLALLERPVGPSVPWTVLLLLGFATWVGGAFAFATRAIDEEDRLVRTSALRWGAVVVVGFALFVLGMFFA